MRTGQTNVYSWTQESLLRRKGRTLEDIPEFAHHDHHPTPKNLHKYFITRPMSISRIQGH